MRATDLVNSAAKFIQIHTNQSYQESKIEAEEIFMHVLGINKSKIYTNISINMTKDEHDQISRILNKRKSDIPLSYVLKKHLFYNHEFFVDENVLIPRPETEIIIDELLKEIGLESSKYLLDVGTGSGCIIISILKERSNCAGTAIDISQKALNVAKYNAKIHQIQNKINFINIDIDKHIYNKYDFVLSNPPYINKFELNRLDSNVKSYEPHLALEAGVDGLNLIRKLILKSKVLLKKRGKLIFEIGEKQVNKSKDLLLRNGFYINKICKDIYLKPRVIISTKL